MLSGKPESIMKRIGILTSGGDCPGLNATIRGVAKACFQQFGTDKVEIVGISNGYYGLIHNLCRDMNPSDFSGILTQGGTILGTKRQPFKMMTVIGEDNVDKVKNMKETYKKQKLDCLLTLGGNGTHKTSYLLAQEGLNVIGLHKAGWLTLSAGIAGGADIILIPEIPYDIEKVCEALLKRAANGKSFSIMAVAEGAFDVEEAKLKKKQRAQKRAEAGILTATSRIAAQVQASTGIDTRVCVPGHMLRGGSPNAYDRLLATKLGVHAAKLIAQERYGRSVAIVGGKVTSNKLADIAGLTKFVDPKGELVMTAKHIGVSFGDE